MNTSLAQRGNDASIVERVLMDGDLSPLTPEQKVAYYNRVCDSLSLNPLTKPFDFLRLNGKMILYARKDATEQLRKRDGVSILRLEREISEGVYVVTAYAVDSKGRQDSSVGAVSIEGLKGENRANAMMKAETKAKRRVTLSICGLGFLDETEIDSIPDARPVRVDIETGVIEGETRAIETKPQPTPAAYDATIPIASLTTRTELDARWLYLLGRAVDLGITEEQFGMPILPGRPLPSSWTIDGVRKAVIKLSGLVAQAEQMADAPEAQAA